MKRRFVIVESPYSGANNSQLFARNIVYLRRVLRDAWERGEHPLASHAYFPLFLDENKPEERKAGIEAGYAMWPLAMEVIFYIDYGMSKGMDAALDRAVHFHKSVLTRNIGINP